MTDSSAESAGAPGQDDACSHPWLRVVCGECGRPLDILGLDVIHPAVRAKESAESAAGPGERRTGVFVVARGHPELVEQLRVALGQSGGVQVIEDRRRTPRDALSPEEVGPVIRNEFRKRILEEEEAGPSDAADDPPR